jgi:hypothetical protein
MDVIKYMFTSRIAGGEVRSRTGVRQLNRRPAYYSTVNLLPGESSAEFEELRKNLIAEWAPDGALEMSCVSDLARLLWRKQNLATLRTAQRARQRLDEMVAEEVNRRDLRDPLSHLLGGDQMAAYQQQHHQAARAVDHRARDELGEEFELTEGDLGTKDALIAELELEERLDAAIDNCLKRLRS